MYSFVLIFVGGGLGCVCRYLLSLALTGALGQFPVATWLANVLGCSLAGALFAYFARYPQAEAQLFLITGFCGGFTTFSTFSYEALSLARQGQWLLWAVYNLSTWIATSVGVMWSYWGMK